MYSATSLHLVTINKHDGCLVTGVVCLDRPITACVYLHMCMLSGLVGFQVSGIIILEQWAEKFGKELSY